MFPTLDLFKLPSVPLSHRYLLPQITAVYLALDANHRVLYVGQAINLQSRWQGHHRLEQLTWLSQKIPVRLAWVPCDPTRLTDMEDYYIALYHPLLNQTSVPQKRIIPAEVTLQQTLTKIGKYGLIFGIAPAQGTELPVVNLRYFGWAREVNNIRRSLKAAQKPPASLRWVETRRRKYGAWWQTKCNGVQIELGPWGDRDRDALFPRTVPRHLAGVALPALPQPVLEEMLQKYPMLGENFPGLHALETDPIPLIWPRQR